MKGKHLASLLALLFGLQPLAWLPDAISQPVIVPSLYPLPQNAFGGSKWRLIYFAPPSGVQYLDMPRMTFDIRGNTVTGSAPIPQMCGSGSRPVQKITGTWIGPHVNLRITAPDGTLVSSLVGVQDTTSGIVRGTASLTDLGTRPFVIIPDNADYKMLNSIDQGDSYRPGGPWTPDLVHAHELEKTSRDLRATDFARAELIELQAIALWDRLPPTDVRKYQAYRRLISYYSGQGSAENKRLSIKQSSVISKLETMIARRPASIDLPPNGRKLAEVMDELAGTYSSVNDAKLKWIYSEILRAVAKDPDNERCFAVVYDSWSRKIAGQSRKQQLEAEAHKHWLKVPDLSLRVTHQLNFISSLWSNRRLIEANYEVKVLAVSLGIPIQSIAPLVGPAETKKGSFR